MTEQIKTLINCSRTVMSQYNTRGFHMSHILADDEVRHIIDDVTTKLKLYLNCTAAGKHAPDTE